MIDNSERVKEITRRLETALTPTKLHIEDESHLHAGHAGPKSGKGHFAVQITSKAFTDKSRIACHKLVYEALGDYMNSDIHALSIKTSHS